MADQDDAKDAPKVGYKNPPKHSQFVKGQSGNPKGRRKGSKNFQTVIQDELKAAVSITENGKRRRISKREAIAKQLVNKAASGDPRAIPLLLQQTREFEASAPVVDQTEQFEPEDERVIAGIMQRILREATTPSPDTVPKAEHKSGNEEDAP